MEIFQNIQLDIVKNEQKFWWNRIFDMILMHIRHMRLRIVSRLRFYRFDRNFFLVSKSRSEFESINDRNKAQFRVYVTTTA